jgi:DNA processing protein
MKVWFGARSAGVGIVILDSPDYPATLRSYRVGGRLYAPPVLYVRPPVSLNRRFIAVVGTRRCTEWGRSTAYRVGELIAKTGFTLVTGLAECVDAEATRGALEAGGLAVGVRPWLEPLTLPREARELLARYRGRLLVVSEHYKRPNANASMLYYLRNRIIAGMSELVVVVEARLGGGSMHQATWALGAGKPLVVFKHPIPGSEYHAAYETYRRLGATTVETLGEVEDILTKLANNPHQL